MKSVIQLNNKKYKKNIFEDSFIILKAENNVTYDDYKNVLKNIGLMDGDTVVLHSELMGLGRIGNAKNREEFADVFIQGILDVIGTKGCLIIPVFSYSYCSKEPFYPLITKSTIGLLPNRFLQWDGIYRTVHPIFSYAGVGGKAESILESDNSVCFSEGSLHRKFFYENVKFCLISNQDLQMCTSVHAMEREFGVPYRYPKIFKGETVINDAVYEGAVEYYVRDLKIDPIPDFSKLKKDLYSKKLVNICNLGASHVACYMASDIWSTALDGLSVDKTYLYRLNQ